MLAVLQTCIWVTQNASDGPRQAVAAEGNFGFRVKRVHTGHCSGWTASFALPAPAEQTYVTNHLLIVPAGLDIHARTDSSSGALAGLVGVYPVAVVRVPPHRMTWVPDLRGLQGMLARVLGSGN